MDSWPFRSSERNSMKSQLQETNELKVVLRKLQKETSVLILDIQTLHAHLFGQ